MSIFRALIKKSIMKVRKINDMHVILIKYVSPEIFHLHGQGYCKNS